MECLITASNELDKLREDTEIWELVSCTPLVTAYRTMMNLYDSWCRTKVEAEEFSKMGSVLSMIEAATYDRFAGTYYRPSVEYETFCRPERELVESV